MSRQLKKPAVPPSNPYGSEYAAQHKLPLHFIGGNRLDVAPPSKVRDFVAEHGGHSVITSVGGSHGGGGGGAELESDWLT